MSAAACRSEPAAALAGVRARAAIRLRFALGVDGTTRGAARFETGGWRAAFPRGPQCEAVLVNTGGGLAGGDAVETEIALDPGADAVVTSQSAEKIYRSGGAPTVLRQRLAIGPGATLAWLPQPTILFDGAALDRRLEIDLDPAGRLALVEALVFGRRARGETMATGAVAERWRVRIGGRLALAEAFALADRPAARLARAAGAAGAESLATVLIHPLDETGLEALRAALPGDPIEAAAGRLDGLGIIRLIGPAEPLRLALAALAERLTGRPPPRVWQC